MIELVYDPDILLYCPSAAAVLGSWIKHKTDGNSILVWGPAVLLHHMKGFYGSLVLVYSVLASWGKA